MRAASNFAREDGAAWTEQAIALAQPLSSRPLFFRISYAVDTFRRVKIFRPFLHIAYYLGSMNSKMRYDRAFPKKG